MNKPIFSANRRGLGGRELPLELQWKFLCFCKNKESFGKTNKQTLLSSSTFLSLLLFPPLGVCGMAKAKGGRLRDWQWLQSQEQSKGGGGARSRDAREVKTKFTYRGIQQKSKYIKDNGK